LTELSRQVHQLDDDLAAVSNEREWLVSELADARDTHEAEVEALRQQLTDVSVSMESGKVAEAAESELAAQLKAEVAARERHVLLMGQQQLAEVTVAHDAELEAVSGRLAEATASKQDLHDLQEATAAENARLVSELDSERLAATERVAAAQEADLDELEALRGQLANAAAAAERVGADKAEMEAVLATVAAGEDAEAGLAAQLQAAVAAREQAVVAAAEAVAEAVEAEAEAAEAVVAREAVAAGEEEAWRGKLAEARVETEQLRSELAAQTALADEMAAARADAKLEASQGLADAAAAAERVAAEKAEVDVEMAAAVAAGESAEAGLAAETEQFRSKLAEAEALQRQLAEARASMESETVAEALVESELTAQLQAAFVAREQAVSEAASVSEQLAELRAKLAAQGVMLDERLVSELAAQADEAAADHVVEHGRLVADETELEALREQLATATATVESVRAEKAEVEAQHTEELAAWREMEALLQVGEGSPAAAELAAWRAKATEAQASLDRLGIEAARDRASFAQQMRRAAMALQAVAMERPTTAPAAVQEQRMAHAVMGYDTSGDGRLDSFDTNDDGKIDMVAATGQRKPGAFSGKNFRRTVDDSFDTNGDGRADMVAAGGQQAAATGRGAGGDGGGSQRQRQLAENLAEKLAGNLAEKMVENQALQVRRQR
jgi:hypothetical protein